MSRTDVDICLRQMLDAARDARAFADKHGRADLAGDRLLTLGVVKAVEIIGEAARRVPEDARAQLPQIPWREIIGMRHRLVHDYDNINYDIVWDVLTNNLPPLMVELEAILKRRGHAGA